MESSSWTSPNQGLLSEVGDPSQGAFSSLPGATDLAQDFGGQVHEAQHVALIPGVEHAEVVRDVVGALLPLGRAQLLRQGARVMPSDPGGLPGPRAALQP